MSVYSPGTPTNSVDSFTPTETTYSGLFQKDVPQGIANSCHQLGMIHEREAYFELFNGNGVSPEFNSIWRRRPIDTDQQSLESFREEIRTHFKGQQSKIVNRYNYEKVDCNSENVALNILFDIDTIAEILKELETPNNKCSQIFIQEIAFWINEINSNLSKEVEFNKVNIVLNQFRRLENGLNPQDIVTKLEDIIDSITPQVKVDVRKFQTYEKDEIIGLVDKAHEAGMKVFRINVEWAFFSSEDKVLFMEMLEGVMNKAKDYDMRRVLFVHHFTYPKNEGEPHKSYFVKNFTKYVKGLMWELSTRDILPEDIYLFNEPFAFLPQSLVLGKWPPFVQSFTALASGVFNTLVAYEKAYKIIKAHNPNVKVGFSENLPVFLPVDSKNPIHRLTSKIYTSLSELWVLGTFALSIKNRDIIFDNLGLQQYGAHRVSPKQLPSANPGELPIDVIANQTLEIMANGWVFIPEALCSKVMRVYSYLLDLSTFTGSLRVPNIAVTENGVASLTRAEQQFDLLKRSLELANSLLPDSILYNLVWSIFGDTSEWGEFLKQTSGFGFYDNWGEKKPNSSKTHRQLDFSSPLIIDESKRLLDSMNNRLRFLERNAFVLERIPNRSEQQDEELLLVNTQLQSIKEAIRKNELYQLLFNLNQDNLPVLEQAISSFNEQGIQTGIIRSQEEANIASVILKRTVEA